MQLKPHSQLPRNEWKYAANLHMDLAPDLPSVQCLPADLNQAILNLIVNAAHAIEAKFGRNPQQKHAYRPDTEGRG